MLQGNNKLQELKERFSSPSESQSVSHTGMNYIGNRPMQEPPYTLSYKRDRKERLERRKNGLPIYQTSSMPAPKKRTTRSNDSETSLTALNPGSASAMIA